jgi:hypothetical protein
MKFIKGIIVFFIGIFIPVLCVLFTVLPLFFIGDLYSNGVFTKWRSLGSPPEKIIKIVGLCNEEICVETENDKVYLFNSYDCNSEVVQSCWEQVDATIVEMPQIITCGYNFQPKPFLPDAIQGIVTRDCGSGGSSEAYYALLKDGNIWVWKNSTTDLQGVGLFILAFPFGIISLIIGAFIAIHNMPILWKKWTKTKL